MKKLETLLFISFFFIFSNTCLSQINNQLLGLYRYEPYHDEPGGVRGEINIDYDVNNKKNICSIQIYMSKNINGDLTYIKVNGLNSKGTYQFNKETNVLKIKWFVPEFNKPMGSWTLNSDGDGLKLINNQKQDLVYDKIIPTLCDCLKAKGGNPSKDIPRGCKNVMLNQYGTTEPTHDQMKEEYYNCP